MKKRLKYFLCYIAYKGNLIQLPYHIAFEQYLFNHMRTVLLLLLVALAVSKYVRQNHDYWYTAPKSTATSKAPYVDYGWNYCDKKCTYLENYQTTPGQYDFVAIQFTESTYKPNFAVCYAYDKKTDSYKLWNSVVKNSWFQKKCGSDTQDWKANPKYKMVGTPLGVGAGVQIDY